MPLWVRIIIIIIIMFMMIIMIIPIVFNIRVLRGEGRDCICDDPKDKLCPVFVFGRSRSSLSLDGKDDLLTLLMHMFPQTAV